MKIDLTQTLKDPKGQPFTRCSLGGDTVFAIFQAAGAAGKTLAEALVLAEDALGRDRAKPMDVGDALYLAVTTSPKAGDKGTPDERRARGRLADLLVADGVVEIDDAQKRAIEEDCNAIFNGVMLVRLDKVFAQALLGAPELVKEPTG